MGSFSLEEPLGEFLARVAAEEPAPAGGSVAALAVALGAGLVAMAARFSHEWPDAVSVAEQADALRARAAALAAADAVAYGDVLAAMRLSGDAAERDSALGAALSRAADVPLDIAEAGAETAVLAALAGDRGNANLRGDATVGALLAEAGARGAAALVAINLAGTPDDERVAIASGLAVRASEAAGRAARRAAGSEGQTL